jgi:signal transduction histidine kinase/DNA-binding response OmpR family regulator
MDDKVNILLVDDLPEKLIALEAILDDLGQNVVTARSGREALRRLMEREFAVILLDVNMPDMDGFETAALIRQHKRCAQTPIIFVTAFGDDMLATQGYSLGAVDYILSPVVPQILRTKVGVFVELFRKTEQVRRHAEEHIALEREQAARAATEAANQRLAFLAEASTKLASSLDSEFIARALARLVVPFLADVGIVVLPDENSGAWHVEQCWTDPSGDVCTCAASQPSELPGELVDAVRRVLNTGKPEILPDVSSWQSTERNGKVSHSTSVQFALDSVAVLPLSAHDHTRGALALGLGRSGRRYTTTDLALAEDLGSRAAVAFENARLYQSVQEADRRKNEFLAMLSHELRNPLAPIYSALHILRMSGPDDPERLEAQDLIERQVRHLTSIVDGLLDVFRITHQKITLHKEPLDLVQAVSRAVEDHRCSLEDHGLTLGFAMPREPVWVMADPTRISQVLSNLLHNAAKFTNPGGQVTVRLVADAAEKRATVSVRDSGIGIAPEMLPHMFETFAQADNSLDRSRGGLGLGLALVKGIVDLHDGGIHASSAGLNQGADIGFWLPLYEKPRPLAKSKSRTTPTAESLRILLVEDNRDTARMLRLLLTRDGHEVAVAHTGVAGLETARSWRPDVLLCDLGLPEMDGYQVARALRDDPASAPPHLIAVSGYGQEADRRRSKEAGFDLHLTKPLDPTELRKLLGVLRVRS